MRRSARHVLRWLGLVGGLACLTGLLAAPAAAIKPPHFKIAVYKIKVSVKGGTNLTNADSGPSNGDVVQESGTASFSLDGTFKAETLYGKPFAKSTPRHGGNSGRLVVNGSWTDQGTKWSDVSRQLTEPFTCSGTIAALVAPGNTTYSWKRTSSKYKFTLAASAGELTTRPPQACPNDTVAETLPSIDPAVYETEFSIPVSQVGQKTIVKQISGPLGKNRKFLPNPCGQSCSFNMAWQGNVRFTRTRLFKMNAGAG